MKSLSSKAGQAQLTCKLYLFVDLGPIYMEVGNPR